MKLLPVLLSTILFLSSCVSYTNITSEPPGAKVYLNDQPVGETPYKHKDTHIIGTTTDVKLEKEGYVDLYTSFSRDEEVDVGPIIGGFFFLPAFLWVMKYHPVHHYDLKPIGEEVEEEQVEPVTRVEVISQERLRQTKAERLTAFKVLLDNGTITKEEFETEKAKILAEE